MMKPALWMLAVAVGLSGRADLSATIRDGGRSGSHSRVRGRARGAIVVTEIALSLVLLVGALLLLRSYANLQQVTGGFTARPIGS
jgi:putative ABC transport system permease protein